MNVPTGCSANSRRATKQY